MLFERSQRERDSELKRISRLVAGSLTLKPIPVIVETDEGSR